MNDNAARENARTLAAALRIDEREAAHLLDITILINAPPGDPASNQLAAFLERLLVRTVKTVLRSADSSNSPALEISVGDIAPLTLVPRIWVTTSPERISIGSSQPEPQNLVELHPVLLLLGACYAAAFAMKAVIGDGLAVPHTDPLILDFNDIFGPSLPLTESFDLGTAYLAGAGAVGNGFLFALSLLDVSGELHIADPDSIEDRNLNRCIWFFDSDLTFNKAERLVELAKAEFSRLVLVPHPVALKDVPAAREGGAWLQRLIVGVDSRRTRRNLQLELPGEVYDASTTGIVEAVLHFNKQPTEGLACLSCIYAQEEGEMAHERHVADSLGVSLEAVREGYVSDEAAAKICLKYSQLIPGDLQGLAYDSLFKQLCAEGELYTAADRQVLAPFSFVSVLAGTYLTLELLRRVHNKQPEQPFNYWRISPWTAPVTRLRSMRPTNPKCSFCGDLILREVVRNLWATDEQKV